MFHKVCSVLAIAALALLLAACQGAVPMTNAPADSAAGPTTLTVSTWGYNMDAIEQNVTLPFEAANNVDIVYETGNNSDRLAKLESRGEGAGIDVVHFAGSFAFRAKEQGLLQPLDPSLLSNYDQLYDWAKDPLGDNAGVGYAINSYLLVYRTDKIADPITSWNDLLRDDVTGFVTVPDLATTFGPATLVMLASANGGDIDNTEPAWERLPQLADQLVTTYRRSSELTTLVQEEEVWLAPYSSFAIGNLLATELPLEKVIPSEGIPASPSVVSIVEGSQNVELAHKYIDFLISQEVQLAQAEALIDSPTNSAVTVSAQVAPLLTYGDPMIDSLIFLDEAKINSQQAAWLERWNEMMQQ